MIVELDGGHHATRQDADAGRRLYLESQGYRVIRFWNNEVFENLEGVLFRIVEGLEATDVPLAATGMRLAPGVRGELGRASHFTFPRSLPSRKGGPEAPGVPIQSGLGRAGSSAGHARARERGEAYPPSLAGRELEGGLVRGREGGSNAPTAPPLVSDGRWVKVTKVDDLWKVNDEWWRGAGEEIARLYYMIRLENSQQLTVYLDLITNNWYRQAG